MLDLLAYGEEPAPYFLLALRLLVAFLLGAAFFLAVVFRFAVLRLAGFRLAVVFRLAVLRFAVFRLAAGFALRLRTGLLAAVFFLAVLFRAIGILVHLPSFWNKRKGAPRRRLRCEPPQLSSLTFTGPAPNPELFAVSQGVPQTLHPHFASAAHISCGFG